MEEEGGVAGDWRAVPLCLWDGKSLTCPSSGGGAGASGGGGGLATSDIMPLAPVLVCGAQQTRNQELVAELLGASHLAEDAPWRSAGLWLVQGAFSKEQHQVSVPLSLSWQAREGGSRSLWRDDHRVHTAPAFAARHAGPRPAGASAAGAAA